MRLSIVILTLATVCLAVHTDTARGQTGDTLTIRLYDCNSELAYFRRTGIEAQVARFLLPAPVEIRNISVIVDSRVDSARGRIRLFGHEGGAAVPLLENDLIEPIWFRTTGQGMERVTVTLDTPLLVSNNQFFVAVDKLDSSVRLLTDKIERKPQCYDGRDWFTYQALKLGNDSWSWENFAFAIDVHVAIAQRRSIRPFADVAESVELRDTMRLNSSIAWYDLDGDGYQDMLWDGRLYLNERALRFVDGSVDAGLYGDPKANAFVDVNRDGLMDILFLGSRSNSQPSRVFMATRSSKFIAHDLTLPLLSNPVSYSIGDVDGNGFPDVVVVQQCGSGDCPVLLLKNDGKGGFTESRALSPEVENLPILRRRNATQLVDLDRDNDLDLFVAASYPGRSVAVLNDGAGQFVIAIEALIGQSEPFGPGDGCHFQDYDNDGDIDLLLPRAIHPSIRRNLRLSSGGVMETMEASSAAVVPGQAGRAHFDWEYGQSGGAWGDANNDGLLDVFLATNSPCGFADMYEQTPSGLMRTTYERGLLWANARADGVWVDFDNDGNLDLVTIIGNRVALLKNPETAGKSWIQLELRDREHVAAVGAKATVYTASGKVSQRVAVGRGYLMADPYRLHFGLGAESWVDSLVIDWPDGARTLHAGRSGGALYEIGDERTDERTYDAPRTLSIRATPLPFNETLTLHYAVPFPMHIRIEILSSTGATIATLVEEVRREGEHQVRWTPKTNDHLPLPSGAYVFRMSTEYESLSGIAILVR